ncbi:MAG TPA: hypothetical protein VFT78_15730 [Hanamia sp.]|nr:hypothetical protein [Hanamia sp.]
MQTLLVLHNLFRWLILFFGFWTLLSAISGLVSSRVYSPADGKANLFFMISMDIQLLLGLALYFMNGWYTGLGNMGESMKEPMVRFFTVEHSFMMIIAWILVHVGRVAVKKSFNSSGKFKKSLIFFGISLLLILIAIPWPFREAVSRPWFRWF